MNEIDALESAAKLIEAGWTRGVHARDPQGQSIVPWSASAVCFCALGAITRAAPNDQVMEKAIINRVRKTLKARGLNSNIAAFNDAAGRTKEEVAELLRAAKTC